MEKKFVKIDVMNEAYSARQIRNTMTVVELIAELEQYDDDTPVVISFDSDYTFGGVHSCNINDYEEEEEV